MLLIDSQQYEYELVLVNHINSRNYQLTAILKLHTESHFNITFRQPDPIVTITPINIPYQ